MRTVILETPFAGEGETFEERDLDREVNIEFGRACLHDCFVNYNEAPFASHLLYTQEGVLDDDNPEQRRRGIAAGLAVGDCLEATVVYVNRGISEGMAEGIKRAAYAGRPVEIRWLLGWDSTEARNRLAARRSQT